MNIGLVAAVSLAIIGFITAHTAGAGYIIAERDNKSNVFSLFRSFASFALIAIALWIAFNSRT